MVMTALKEEKMNKIKDEVRNCKKCELWKTRNNPVIGKGNLNAKLMFIGEAPGYHEDIKGEPFVGRAGKIFDELLESLGLKREDIYIANILKCRPPNNRNPLESEIKMCALYLDKQISIIRPKIIVTLGSFASAYILEKFGLKRQKISEMHGRMFNVSNLLGIEKIISMYHPAVATYNPNMKGVLLRDFKSIDVV